MLGVREGRAGDRHLEATKTSKRRWSSCGSKPFVVPEIAHGRQFERVDTRVLQVIFGFERGDLPIYVGSVDGS